MASANKPASKSFAGGGALVPHLLQGAHGLSGEVADLRNDVDTAFVNLEARSNMPRIDQVVGGAGLSLGAVPGAAAAINGSNLLQGQPLDTLAYGTGTSLLTVKANRPGQSNIQLALTDGGGTHAVSVSGAGTSVSPYVITVNFRGATHSNTDGASAIATAINAHATAKTLVTATSGGSGNVVALLATALAGGNPGDGLSVQINAIEQDIIGTPTEASIPMVTKDFTGLSAGDMSNLVVTSKGRMTNLAVRIIA